ASPTTTYFPRPFRPSPPSPLLLLPLFFFFNHPPTTDIYTLSLHDALPILQQCPLDENDPSAARRPVVSVKNRQRRIGGREREERSEEHTSELQSLTNLVCRLLLEKKKHN